MTTPLLITITLVFLLIIVGITFRKPIIRLIRKRRDTKLRKWCIKQAVQTDLTAHIDLDTGVKYACEWNFISLAEKYYLFLTEHITYLTDGEKEAIFPEKYKKKEDS